MSSHQVQCLPTGLFPVDLPVKILKELLHYFILATLPVHLNFVDLDHCRSILSLIIVLVKGEQVLRWMEFKVV